MFQSDIIYTADFIFSNVFWSFHHMRRNAWWISSLYGSSWFTFSRCVFYIYLHQAIWWGIFSPFALLFSVFFHCIQTFFSNLFTYTASPCPIIYCPSSYFYDSSLIILILRFISFLYFVKHVLLPELPCYFSPISGRGWLWKSIGAG